MVLVRVTAIMEKDFAAAEDYPLHLLHPKLILNYGQPLCLLKVKLAMVPATNNRLLYTTYISNMLMKILKFKYSCHHPSSGDGTILYLRIPLAF